MRDYRVYNKIQFKCLITLCDTGSCDFHTRFIAPPPPHKKKVLVTPSLCCVLYSPSQRCTPGIFNGGWGKKDLVMNKSRSRLLYTLEPDNRSSEKKNRTFYSIDLETWPKVCVIAFYNIPRLNYRININSWLLYFQANAREGP